MSVSDGLAPLGPVLFGFHILRTQTHAALVRWGDRGLDLPDVLHVHFQLLDLGPFVLARALESLIARRTSVWIGASANRDCCLANNDLPTGNPSRSKSFVNIPSYLERGSPRRVLPPLLLIVRSGRI